MKRAKNTKINLIKFDQNKSEIYKYIQHRGKGVNHMRAVWGVSCAKLLVGLFLEEKIFKKLTKKQCFAYTKEKKYYISQKHCCLYKLNIFPDTSHAYGFFFKFYFF